MIYTVTFSPSIDLYTDLNELKIGEINRSNNPKYIAGGKGINVSILLKNHGIESVCTGFVGGFSGNYIMDELDKLGIKHDFVEINDTSRINIKIVSKDETAINLPAPKVTKEEITLLFNKLKALNKGDYVLFCGAFPIELEMGMFLALLKDFNNKGIYFIVDTTKAFLKESLALHPFLIKPNKEELAELYGLQEDFDVDLYAKQLIHDGAKNTIVSLGKEGAILVNNDICEHINALKGNVISTVGAGDSLLGGFMYKYLTGSDIKESAKYGVLCGSYCCFNGKIPSKEDII